MDDAFFPVMKKTAPTKILGFGFKLLKLVKVNVFLDSAGLVLHAGGAALVDSCLSLRELSKPTQRKKINKIFHTPLGLYGNLLTSLCPCCKYNNYKDIISIQTCSSSLPVYPSSPTSSYVRCASSRGFWILQLPWSIFCLPSHVVSFSLVTVVEEEVGEEKATTA